MASNFNYSELDALTEKYYVPVLQDQIFQSDPLLDMIRKNKKTVGGAKSFSVPVKYDHLNSGVYTANQVFPNEKKEIANAVDIEVGGYFTELVSDGFEEALQGGTASVRNLLEEKLKDMTDSMSKQLRKGLYGDYVAGGFRGLKEIVDDKNTLYGLNRLTAGNEYWKSVVLEDAVDGIDLSGDAGYQKLRNFYMQVTSGGTEKNIVWVGDYTTINKIEFMLASRNQITTVREAEANLGFESFKLFNRPVMASPELEDIAQATGQGILYAINADYLTMYTLGKADFVMTEFKTSQKNNLRIKQLLVEGNYVAQKPKNLGVIKNIII